MNSFGAFNFSFKLSEDVNLGSALVKLELKDPSQDDDRPRDVSDPLYEHRFNVQDFKPPQFKAKASLESKDAIVYRGEALLKGQAEYYAGGALPESPVTWLVKSKPVVGVQLLKEALQSAGAG